tara:strand:- start:1052 stop:1426 length:375 start_codon:yes stop_codon:yes gene_type:complete
MAQTIPVYINGDTIRSTSIPNGSESTAAAITTSSGAITQGLLIGVHGKLASHSGAVIVRVYSDEAKTLEIYKTTLTFTDPATNLSDLMTQPVPFFETPYFTVEGDATSGTKNFDSTFYVQAVRF